jgi:hypothetical protein
MSTGHDEREVQRFLADVLAASGYDVVENPKYFFADGSRLVADLVAQTPGGDLIVFEIGRPTPESSPSTPLASPPTASVRSRRRDHASS